VHNEAAVRIDLDNLIVLSYRCCLCSFEGSIDVLLCSASLSVPFSIASCSITFDLQGDWSSITKSRGRSDPNTQLGVRLVAGKLMLCRPDNKLESHRLVTVVAACRWLLNQLNLFKLVLHVA
jgi:hypothetical protein